MKILQELVRFNRLDDEEDTEDFRDEDFGDDEFADEDLIGDEPPADDEFADEEPMDEFGAEEELPDDEALPDDEMLGGEEGADEFSDEPPMDEPTEPEDPNRQGMIRTVKGAHLVYKREVEDGTYEELWLYNSSTLRDEIVIRKAILAGTDIPVNKSQSPDGSQSYEMWSVGNAEMVLVKGLQQ